MCYSNQIWEPCSSPFDACMTHEATQHALLGSRAVAKCDASLRSIQLDITCPAVLRSRRVLSQGLSDDVTIAEEALAEAQHRLSRGAARSGSGHLVRTGLSSNDVISAKEALAEAPHMPSKAQRFQCLGHLVRTGLSCDDVISAEAALAEFA